MKRILIPLWGDDIAPRFDTAQEVLIAVAEDDGRISDKRVVILPEASAEGLCNLILHERVDEVICCGIEDEYYQYLAWKKVQVIDSVGGPASVALERSAAGSLKSEEILVARGRE
ncbi:MAG: dinitrogenase iron-molybdenum cofactor biosynthesis protein [Desulfomonile sp.]|nr:dinitrogenase iron-molybdenum cofactor biosynthesis protein [Desulfomonile sp.]